VAPFDNSQNCHRGRCSGAADSEGFDGELAFASPGRHYLPIIQELALPPAPLLLYVDAQYASPYAMAAFVALREKAVPFEVGTIDLAAKENEAPKYSRLSLTRRVPTLVDQDFCLSESSAICEYIDESFSGTPLFPTDRRTRARARQVQAWLRSDLLPIRVERSTEVIFFKPTALPLSDAAQTCTQKLFFAAEALIPKDAENLFGQWSIADVDLALMLNRLVLNGDPVPQRLAAYATQQWQRPSVQQWVNQRRSPL